jgi:hypothetical protein
MSLKLQGAGDTLATVPTVPIARWTGEIPASADGAGPDDKVVRVGLAATERIPADD